MLVNTTSTSDSRSRSFETFSLRGIVARGMARCTDFPWGKTETGCLKKETQTAYCIVNRSIGKTGKGVHRAETNLPNPDRYGEGLCCLCAATQWTRTRTRTGKRVGWAASGVDVRAERGGCAVVRSFPRTSDLTPTRDSHTVQTAQ